ncbi:MAG: glycosyltransferase family 2 protein [Patescibacteria group bacterium]|jgi:GT2 family glycosyltransferase|nr:glycosyltransferase family 2 protein [Patescibacteria group bacterium]
MKKVGIILVNFKDYAQKYLSEFRDGLLAQNYPSELVNYYMVDNASSEPSRKYLSENFPESIIIPRKDGNYASANNVGARKAIEDGCEYIVIANIDTSFDKSWLSELVKALDENEKAGIAQSKILLYPKNNEEIIEPKINSLGNIMHFLGFGFTSAYKEKDRELNGYPEIKGYASGCSFIIRKEVFEKIGGYDGDYYMYHDDVEVSWKTKLLGYKIILAPKSIIFHKYEFSRSVRMLYYMERNRYLVMFQFYSGLTLLLIMPAIVIMELGMWFFSIVNSWIGVKVKASLYFFSPLTWKKIFKKRKFLAGIKKEKEKNIIKYFEGRVLFQEISNPVLKYIANPLLNLYWKIIKIFIIW